MSRTDEVRLAYVISAYRYPGQLVTLVDALDEPTTSIVISVDRATDDATFEAMWRPLVGRRNVHFLPRHSSPYRSFGHVRSTLRGIDHLLGSRIPFDHLSVITGQDLPIKSNDEIRRRLDEADGDGFIEYFSLPDDLWSGGGMTRFSSMFLHTHRRHLSIGRRRFAGLIPPGLPFDVTPFGGSGYWTLPRDIVEYVAGFVRRNPAWVRYFRTTDMPDETFFHTIVLNSPFASRIRCDDLRHIDFTDPVEVPRIWRSDDYDALAASDDLFARKFDATVDSGIIERVVANLAS
ncbi:MAG: hypothetical protein JST73_09665 [Actinobacteria bacterium]|nr:hypothetical protein [Actinomycetota bacterium]